MIEPSRSDAATRRLNTLLGQQSIRLAHVLHDEASQFLVSAHMAIADIAHDVPETVQARLQEVRLQLNEVAEQLRRVSQELHPGILDDLGLTEAVRFLGRTFSGDTGVDLAMEVHVDERCPATVAVLVYRFVQAALKNIGDHAEATSASIAIALEDSRLVCAICDDGVGFDVDAALARSGDHGLGLVLIKDRIEAAGGTLEIASGPEQGTRLLAVVPLEA
jgi:signal transduction histidine kinase